jgi:hypothetical protein
MNTGCYRDKVANLLLVGMMAEVLWLTAILALKVQTPPRAGPNPPNGGLLEREREGCQRG